jgi:hypothetical protein
MTISTLILILLLTAKARAAGKAAVQERAPIVRWILCPPFRSYGRATVSHCGPLRRDRRSAAFPAARGGKWSAVQVARLLEAASIPFDASAVVA